MIHDRQLAKISRSTRGIVLLLCDLNAARRVMSEAQRLKMTGGHFIWIWADTSSTAEFFDPNSVPSDDTKNNFQYNERKSKFDKLESSGDRQFYLQSGNKRPQQNSTRHKSSNTNSNRFHHIIGLRKPGEDNNDDGGLPAVLPDRSFLSADQAPVKDKRDVDKVTTMDSVEVDYDNNVEKSNNLNIKNINSHEFNANYYDPYSLREHENIENVFGGDQDESHEDNAYWDYGKSNPFQPRATSATFTTRRPASDTKDSKANNRKNDNDSNRSNRNNANNHKPPSDQITTIPHSKTFDDKDDLDLENYSEASESDLKAKRADNFPSAFNISSHVFFHHFKDFPVGLLALRHIKMNVDRVFVRSAVRLFATTWSRVERDEELRAASGGKVSYRPKSNWEDSWSDYDYDEVNINQRTNKKQKNKNNFSVNNRHNNGRGSRKFKRDAQEVESESATDDNKTISKLVNSSNKTTINSNSKLITNKTYSQHASGLNSHASVDENKSNNDNIKSNSNKTGTAVNGSQEIVHELRVKGEKEVEKRQNSWWSNTFRGRSQEKSKPARGTPQYKGGCFGVPTRSDLKRSELFAR